MRFVKPEVERIDLGNKEWIEVKKELTKGEDTRYRTAGMKRMQQDKDGQASIEVDWEKMAFARAVAYLTDWCVFDGERPVPYKADSVAALAPEDFKRIDDAIHEHTEKMAAEKKVTDGGTASPPPSP